MNSAHLTIPESIARDIRELRFDADARRSYDAFAGGFCWSDEHTPDLQFRVIREARGSARFLFRSLFAYRASVIRGVPDQALEPVWAAMSQQFPEWPGFRQDRCDHALRAALQAADEATAKCFDQLVGEFGSCGPNTDTA